MNHSGKEFGGAVPTMWRLDSSPTPCKQEDIRLDSITPLDFSKKAKNFSPLEPFLGVLGFILVTFLFIGCLFNFHYRAVHFRGVPWLGFVGVGSSPSL
ncbi:hypothetical protein SLEP1_g34889 [Rubroshorea leprosula]|uniref:Uncharacterized protein n=1 Tax=Rubroshorea leprosula TaxID=152421 RepID=A0AAV5KLG0_9ROSI|nr:hypothetical protein SLEP1_g34889 [Rubroshorea leprosula]